MKLYGVNITTTGNNVFFLFDVIQGTLMIEVVAFDLYETLISEFNVVPNKYEFNWEVFNISKVKFLETYKQTLWFYKQKHFFFLQELAISAEFAACKPSADFFNKTLLNYTVKFENIIFIDDSEKNVNGASMLGFNFILYSSIKDLNEIRRLVI